MKDEEKEIYIHIFVFAVYAQTDKFYKKLEIVVISGGGEQGWEPQVGRRTCIILFHLLI